MFRPKVLYQRSKNEPARTILLVVTVLTIIAEIVAVIVVPTTLMFFNGIVVLALCCWGAWAAETNNIRQMSMAAFWVFMMWLYSSIQSMVIADSIAGALVWFPMFVVAACLGIVYIYLSGIAKVGKDE